MLPQVVVHGALKNKAYLILNNFHFAAFAQPISPLYTASICVSQPWSLLGHGLPGETREASPCCLVTHVQCGCTPACPEPARVCTSPLMLSVLIYCRVGVIVTVIRKTRVHIFCEGYVQPLLCACSNSSSRSGGSNPLMPQILRINVKEEEPQHFFCFFINSRCSVKARCSLLEES